MPILDITNDLDNRIFLNGSISTDTTTFTSFLDMASYDDGFMLTFWAGQYTDGTFVLTLQDSPDSSVWTDVPTEKLIDPAGLGSLTVTASASLGDTLPRIGAFSTDRFLRAKIVSTSTTFGSFLTVALTRKPEQTPAP